MECIERIRNDAHFQRVLAVALDIGNYVNGGKRQGKAYGFSMGTLEKLDQFPRRRNPDGLPATTMLEHIYILIQRKEPEVLSWTDNLQIMEQAVTVDLQIVNARFKGFQQTMSLLFDRLQSADESQSSGKNFVEKMQPFYEHSGDALNAFNASLRRVNGALQEIGKWFDVEGDDKLEFLKQINSFRKNFQSIGQRLEQRAKEAERKKKRGQKRNGSRNGDRRTMAETLAAGMAKRRRFMSGDNPPVPGGVAMPGHSRQESIIRAAKQKQPLKLDGHGNLTRPPSVSISRGALTNELWRYAASVENKVSIK